MCGLLTRNTSHRIFDYYSEHQSILPGTVQKDRQQFLSPPLPPLSRMYAQCNIHHIRRVCWRHVPSFPEDDGSLEFCWEQWRHASSSSTGSFPYLAQSGNTDYSIMTLSLNVHASFLKSTRYTRSNWQLYLPSLEKCHRPRLRVATTITLYDYDKNRCRQGKRPHRCTRPCPCIIDRYHFTVYLSSM
jgi:hypothetical protein